MASQVVLEADAPLIVSLVEPWERETERMVALAVALMVKAAYLARS